MLQGPKFNSSSSRHRLQLSLINTRIFFWAGGGGSHGGFLSANRAKICCTSLAPRQIRCSGCPPLNIMAASQSRWVPTPRRMLPLLLFFWGARNVGAAQAWEEWAGGQFDIEECRELRSFAEVRMCHALPLLVLAHILPLWSSDFSDAETRS
jgi:hypothetical protein